MKRLSLILVFVAVARCKPAIDGGDGRSNDVLGSVINSVRDCVEGDVSLCLKERALKYAERLATAREVNLVDGISLLGTGSPRSARALEPLSDEPQAREAQVENRLVDAAAEFLENHVVQLRVPKSTVEDVKRSLEEGRGKKKKLKQLIPIFALLQLKFSALIPLFLGIIAFVAVKALLLAKAAVFASGLILLKKLLSKHEHHESYEVVAHPHHEEHGHPHGGWGRSSDAQDMAYNAYSQ